MTWGSMQSKSSIEIELASGGNLSSVRPIGGVDWEKYIYYGKFNKKNT